jgi:hypothetical protein
MLKPDKNFRMRKHLKWTFSGIHDAHQRGVIKRSMIDAQLASEIRPREKKNRNQPDLETT